MTTPFNNTNLSGISDNNSIHDIEQRFNAIETRLTSIEDDIYHPDGNSFASQGSLHLSNLDGNNLDGNNQPNQQPNGTLPLGFGATNAELSINGNASTLGGKRRKTKKQRKIKKQKKTKKRGNKGKRLTKRNRK